MGIPKPPDGWTMADVEAVVRIASDDSLKEFAEWIRSEQELRQLRADGLLSKQEHDAVYDPDKRFGGG